MMPPRISVLMPCFNHGQYIGEAIGSVLAQTIDDFEIVIVDDGSTEPSTRDALATLAEPRIQVLRTENRGLPAARNYAAAHASGAIFCALDADDRLAPTWFEKGLRALDTQPQISFVSHWLETFGDEQWTWMPERCDLPSLLARNTVNGAALVRREAFAAVGGYDESMRDGCEDWDFWLRLVESGFPGTIVQEVLFHYRRRADSMSRGMLHMERYRRPLDILVAKHAEAYRQHLPSVIASQEAEVLHLADEIAELERARLVTLEPALRRAREELDAMVPKIERARAARQREDERERLQWQVTELQTQVHDLHQSLSWRITAPLRTLYAVLTNKR